MPVPRLPAALLILCTCLAPACREPTARHSDAARATSNDELMGWWRQARFGLFIHWGLYAVPAGEWNGRTNHAEWIRDTARIPLAQYEQFQQQFNPTQFDADAWVALARQAGMRYLVITSKHHDGFCLFDSKQTDWDVMGTPFHRDVLAELAAACARGGVRFATYHSIMDWHHPDYLPRRQWETGRTTAGADFDRFVDYLRAQVTEVITNYHPAVMWFDGEWESTWTHERGVALYELCKRLDPAIVVNNRVDVHRGGMAGLSQSSEAVGDFGTPEQEIPANGLPGVDWETCMTMNDHWGWNRNDRDWKPVPVLVRNLIDVVSKGGNYLLNVGPKADGTFPQQAVDRLRAIGVWMRGNGDAIHGTTASPFEPLPWGRCTVKRDGADTILYLHVFERPADGRLVLPLGNEPRSATWLADSREPLPVRRQDAGVVVELPTALPDPIASVVTLRIAGAPIVYRAPAIVAAADLFVRPLRVTLEGADAGSGLQVRYTLDGSDPTADSPPYAVPLDLTATTEVRARAFDGERAVTDVVRRRFELATPKPGSSVRAGPAGLEVREFAGDWDRLPDFAQLTPIAAGSGIANEIGVAPASQDEHTGLAFHGWFGVGAADVYTFALSSDDGSDLWIDGERIVDNDGLHGTQEQRGHAALGPGLHQIRVRWFNKTGGRALSLRWAPLGGELVPMRGFTQP